MEPEDGENAVRSAETISRREFGGLAARLVLAALSPALLAAGGCGGSGGESGGPPAGSIAGAGSVSASELPGAVSVASAYGTASITGGKFSVPVSATGCQMVAATGANGECHGLALSMPASASVISIDAHSTAVALVFLTPGILATDPATASARISEITALSSIQALITFLGSPAGMAALSTQSGGDLGNLVAACISEWRAAQSAAASPNTVEAGGVSAAFVPGGPPQGQAVRLTNSGFRFVAAYGVQIALTPMARIDVTSRTVVPGASPLSWASLFTGKSGAPGTTTYTEFLAHSTQHLEFFMVGPGTDQSGHAGRPKGVPAFDTAASAYTFIYYVMLPLIDVVIGAAGLEKAGLQTVDALWSLMQPVVGADIGALATGGITPGEAKSTMRDALAGALTNAGLVKAVLGRLVKDGLARGAGLAVSQALLPVRILGAVMTVANVALAAETYLKLPGISETDLPLSGSIGVTIQ
jgi:hypothetical protein